jgi:hypothetical protein
MMNGKSGLPAEVEQALFDRARSREDILSLKSTQEATQAWAARGFTLPPGMLTAQVNAIQDENRLKTSAMNRDVYIKAQETLIQQLNVAVEKVVNVEQLMINLHNSVQQRRLDMEKIRVEQAIAIFNAKIQQYNILAQVYATEANVYKIKIEAELPKLEIFKAQIEAQKLVGQVNLQEVEVYKANLDALKNTVELYKARVDGISAVVQVGTNQVNAYRAQVDAYNSRLQAESIKYQIYKTRVDAETAKVGVTTAEASVYSTKLRQLESIASLSAKKVEGFLELTRQNTAVFMAEAEAERTRMTAEADVFRSKITKYAEDVKKLVVSDERVVKELDFNLKEYDTEWQQTLRQHDINVRKYDADQVRMIEVARLQQDAAKALAQYSSQLAAGAMSAVHLGAQAGGSASSQTSYTVTKSI